MKEPAKLEDYRADGVVSTLEVPAGALAFTYCQLPVIYEQSERRAIRLIEQSGEVLEIAGDTLPPEISQEIFERSGRFQRLHVLTAPGLLS